MTRVAALLLFLLFIPIAHAQKTELLFQDDISIRAIQLYDGKVWYAGTDSRFGYINLQNPAERKQISLTPDKLEFRTLANDHQYFYMVSINSPAYFYRVRINDFKVMKMNTDSSPNAFYDALKFVSPEIMYAFSDSDKDHSLKMMLHNTRKSNGWQRMNYLNHIKMHEGEAAFAASNSNIAASDNFVWIVTGGAAARIIRLDQKKETAEVFETPFIQGTSSQGIYSIDFVGDQFGIAVGGDYTKQDANISNIATTRDAGKTWQIQASGQNAGYSSCVKIRPGSGGQDIIAVGDRHISLSQDFGKTWNKISDEQGFYTVEWLDGNTVILAGKNKISRLKLDSL